MGLRETLNRNPAITTGATIVIIVLAVGFIIYSQVGSGVPKPPKSAWYTTDDGASWFEDDINKISPFTKDGKEAIRIYVFECKDGKKFAGYMERYTPEAKKQLEALNAKQAALKPGTPEHEQASMEASGIMQNVMMTGMQYKKPGAAGKWVAQMDGEKFSQVVSITCPDTNDYPRPVNP